MNGYKKQSLWIIADVRYCRYISTDDPSSLKQSQTYVFSPQKLMQKLDLSDQDHFFSLNIICGL